MADLSGIGAEERRFIADWLRVSLKGYRVAEGFADGVPCVYVQVMRPDDCGDGRAFLEVYATVGYRRRKRREGAAGAVFESLSSLGETGRYQGWSAYEPMDCNGLSTVLAVGYRTIGNKQRS
ncbi:hypothetical protein [Collinsella tanakaei]|uniref:hypothetical protein n=1 Tax=Collinsella tanakaei TaxID=626935 RepID=UPI00195CC1C6|nr:hypothetical protein [Collinsella tanakaei]MBM6868912.1 hypothetical protein [Collinsella tanakaei]